MKKFIFEILLERLKWPDMLVREQTFHAIKDFLIANKTFKDNFLFYLESQLLETKTLELLSIIYLINQEESNYFTFSEVDSKIKLPSLLSDICLEEIFGREVLNLYKDRPWIKNHSIEAPENFKAEIQTKKDDGLVKSNLDYLKTIAPSGMHIQEQFDFEYDYLLNQEKRNRFGKIDYFYEMRHAGFPNIKLYQYDIQISAFLRLVSFYVDIYNLPLEYAILLTQVFFPIDLGLLELKPTNKPLFINEIIDNEFKSWDFGINEYIPVYLSCPLKMDTNSFSDKEISSIEVYPVHLAHTPPSLEQHFNFFRSGELWEKMRKISWHSNIKKLRISNDIPKNFIGLFHKCYNYVQKLYTIDRDLFIPNEENLKIEINNDKLIFKVDNTIIGFMQYWYDNYTTFSYKDTTVCSGLATYLHRDYINKINNNNDITLLINYQIFNMDPKNEQFQKCKNEYFSIKL